jgi:hypothetical protein
LAFPPVRGRRCLRADRLYARRSRYDRSPRRPWTSGRRPAPRDGGRVETTDGTDHSCVGREVPRGPRSDQLKMKSREIKPAAIRGPMVPSLSPHRPGRHCAAPALRRRSTDRCAPATPPRAPFLHAASIPPTALRAKNNVLGTPSVRGRECLRPVAGHLCRAKRRPEPGPGKGELVASSARFPLGVGAKRPRPLDRCGGRLTHIVVGGDTPANAPARRHASTATGSSTQNLAPSPTSDVTPTVPPCASMTRRTVARPRPIPGTFASGPRT